MVPQQFLRQFESKLGVGIITAAFNGGQPRSGVEKAPRLLMEAGLLNQLSSLNWIPEYEYNTEKFSAMKPDQDPDFGGLKNPRFVGAVCESVAEGVKHYVQEGKLALTIGGDHSLGLGSIAGSAMAFEGKKDICVIWVDAHADLNTPDTTDSGNIHGMPLSWLLGLTKNGVPGFRWAEEHGSYIKKENLVYIGLRDVDAGEKKLIKDLGIKAFSMHEVDRYGIGAVMDMALNHINPAGDKPIHLSFDVDALDPTVAPSTGTPVRGGLTFREGHFICERVHETGLLVAFDLMEVNPTLGDDAQQKQTVQIGCSLTRAALGETLL